MKIKKNIAFIIYSLHSGGAERVLTTLANHFCKMYNITIITIINKPSFYKLDNDIKTYYCLNKVIKSENIIKAVINNIKLLRIIKRHLREQKIDLVISFMTTSNVLSLLATKSLKIPCIISERSNPYIYTQNLFWNKLMRFTYPKADYLVVQSKLIEDYYQKFISPNKVIILPNPISEKLSLLKNDSLKRKNIILTVGRLDRNKAQDLLIKAFANLNPANWQLTFIGEGSLLQEYLELTKSLNIEDRVNFIGNVQDIENYYNSASIFAFTSRSEGFPNTLLEAMYFKMACVSTDCPTGPSEIIKDRQNGFLIEVDNQSQLEDRLQKLINSESLRINFGIEAYKTARSYEIDNVGGQWNKLIKELL